MPKHEDGSRGRMRDHARGERERPARLGDMYDLDSHALGVRRCWVRRL